MERERDVVVLGVVVLDALRTVGHLRALSGVGVVLLSLVGYLVLVRE